MGAEGRGDRCFAGEKVAANIGVGRYEGVNELEGRCLLLALVDLEPAEVGAIEAVATPRREGIRMVGIAAFAGFSNSAARANKAQNRENSLYFPWITGNRPWRMVRR